DAQKGPARSHVILNRRDESTRFEPRHGVGKCANSWQHELVGSRDCFGIVVDGRYYGEPFECLLDTPQIAHPVGDNRDHRSLFHLRAFRSTLNIWKYRTLRQSDKWNRDNVRRDV